jgi:hypothetical protein
LSLGDTSWTKGGPNNEDIHDLGLEEQCNPTPDDLISALAKSPFSFGRQFEGEEETIISNVGTCRAEIGVRDQWLRLQIQDLTGVSPHEKTGSRRVADNPEFDQ